MVRCDCTILENTIKNERLTQLKEKSVFTSINYLILELLLNMLYWTKTEVFY